MIELTINGRNIITKQGSTILAAALQNGIKIPHLCYDKRLMPHGGCRLCVVEIEGKNKLEASCATFASEGMVVKTETPRVKKIRQTVLELMLVHHPLDCPVCDKAGECPVQDMVFEYGKPEGRFRREKKHEPADTRGPLVELHSSRCVLCGKCVRVCAEHQGRGALGFIGRGFSTVVQPAFGEALECDYCGQCIDACPTGALLNKNMKYKSRSWFLDEQDSICSFCSCGCTVTLGMLGGKILRSRGKQSKGVSGGDLCGRGRFGFDYIYSDKRLTSPMIRKKEELVPVSWAEAIEYVSYRLGKTIIDHGPQSIGAIGSPRCTNEENYLLQKFMRETLGSGNIDSSAHFGYGSVEKAWKMAFGRMGHSIDLQSPLGRDILLVIESDLTITHPFFGLNILQARKKGSRLVVIDSRETKLTKNSSQWIKIRQGTAVALLNGVMKIIIDNGLVDVRKALKIPGYQALKEKVKEYTPERVRELTGVTAEGLAHTADALVKAGSRLITFSVGVSENTKGMDTVLAATNLVNLLGDAPETVQIPAEYANSLGLYQMGVRPDAGPYNQMVESAGLGVPGMLYEPGVLKAMYIMGSDPVANFPNTSMVVSSLKLMELLIVQDIALTDTAKMAHVVLPAAGWAEKEGIFTNTEGREQKLSRMVRPSGESLPDWQIISSITKSMGRDFGITDRKDIEREIGRLRDACHESTDISPAFNPVHCSTGEKPSETFPLSMVLRDVLPHAGSISSRSRTLNLVASEAKLEMNRNDAKKYGVEDRHYVRIISRRGTAYLKAEISDTVPDGMVYVPSHFPHCGVSNLTGLPDSGRTCLDAVRVETV